MITRKLATAIIVGLMAPAALWAPAQATELNPGDPSDESPADQLPDVTTGPTSDSGGYNSGQVKNCSVVSSPSYLGLACGSATGQTVNVARVLGDDPVPTCWHDALTDDEREAMGGRENIEGPDGNAWYWQRCVKEGTITKHPNHYAPEFTIGLINIKNDKPKKTLTENQKKLIGWSNEDGMIPYPVAGVSPSAQPRVGAWVSFFDGTRHTVQVVAGSVILRATVESIRVEPLGAGQESIGCSGTGHIARAGDTPDSHPGACWWKYTRSSADQPDDRYPVNMTAHWVVRVTSDGGTTWTTFNQFDKSQITTIPVTEIQALVVG